jgi:hypothetical protein
MIIKNKYATFVVHKVLSKAYVVVQQWTAPDAPSATGVLASTLLTTAVQTITTGITNPDFPRILNVDSDGAASGNVVITGTNIRGETISDTIALNGTNVVAGTKAFKTVTSIQLPVKQASESVFVGTTDKLGLQSIPISTSVISETTANQADTGGALLTRDSDEIEKCVYDPTTECNGTADKTIVYISVELPKKVGAYTE